MKMEGKTEQQKSHPEDIVAKGCRCSGGRKPCAQSSIKTQMQIGPLGSLWEHNLRAAFGRPGSPFPQLLLPEAMTFAP